MTTNYLQDRYPEMWATAEHMNGEGREALQEIAYLRGIVSSLTEGLQAETHRVVEANARVAALEEAGDALHKYADDEFVDAVGLSYPSECCGCSCGNDGDGWNEPACDCGHQDGCTYLRWLEVAEAWGEVRGG